MSVRASESQRVGRLNYRVGAQIGQHPASSRQSPFALAFPIADARRTQAKSARIVAGIFTSESTPSDRPARRRQAACSRAKVLREVFSELPDPAW